MQTKEITLSENEPISKDIILNSYANEKSFVVNCSDEYINTLKADDEVCRLCLKNGGGVLNETSFIKEQLGIRCDIDDIFNIIALKKSPEIDFSITFNVEIF